jgi:glucose/arabinose dehydrogenase
MSRRVALALLIAATLGAAAPARALPVLPLGFRDTLVAGALALPSAFAFVPDAQGSRVRAIVAESKVRNLRVFGVPAVTGPSLMGTIDGIQWVEGERGLLSVAVDPRWPAKPFVYVHYTATGGTMHVARFRVSGDLANTGSGSLTLQTASRLLLVADIPDSLTNHNGGSVRFGPDSMLYVSLGDDQQACRSQDTTSLLGKVLRLDVRALPDTGSGPVPRALVTPADNPNAASPDSNFRLVYAMGLRNPFRLHVDPADGALFVADVGQSRWEEINRVTGFTNLGWPWREGPEAYTSCGGPAPPGLVPPILALPYGEWTAVIGMGVYRAPAGAASAFPAEYEGDIFYADYYAGFVRRASFDGTSWANEPAFGQPNPTDWATGYTQVVDALVGRDGALWTLVQSVDYTFFNGELRRVTWVGVTDTTTAAPARAGRVRLSVPAPNPARGAVRLAWELPASAPVELAIHDAAGRRVRTLERGARAAGAHATTWDGRDDAGRAMPPGVYLARLRVSGSRHVQRIALVR